MLRLWKRTVSDSSPQCPRSLVGKGARGQCCDCGRGRFRTRARNVPVRLLGKGARGRFRTWARNVPVHPRFCFGPRRRFTIDRMSPGAVRIEYASQRKIRTRNKVLYRIAHWPIWIWVFFISPGPSTFELFAHGFNQRRAVWLGLVVMCTGIAALFGKLPGSEPAPYIIRFTEDKPNPLYRRICYTFAWNVVLNFALLNLGGLVVAVVAGKWYLQQIFAAAYFPIATTVWALGGLGLLPRVKPSTQG